MRPIANIRANVSTTKTIVGSQQESMQLIQVTQVDLQKAIRTLDLSGQVVCVHSSLRSFGQVSGGARAVVQAFLDEGCTLLVPTFSYDYTIAPPPHLQPPRNG